MSNQSDLKDSFLHVNSFRKENDMIFSEGDDDFYIVSTGNSEKTCSHCGRIIEQGEPCRMNHKFIGKWQEKCHIFSVAYELPQNLT